MLRKLAAVMQVLVRPFSRRIHCLDLGVRAFSLIMRYASSPPLPSTPPPMLSQPHLIGHFHLSSRSEYPFRLKRVTPGLLSLLPTVPPREDGGWRSMRRTNVIR